MQFKSGNDVLPDENTPQLEQIKQSIFDNVQAGGDINLGDITQNITINQPEPFKQSDIILNIPYRGVAKFIGRTEEMLSLHQLLHETDTRISHKD